MEKKIFFLLKILKILIYGLSGVVLIRWPIGSAQLLVQSVILYSRREREMSNDGDNVGADGG